MAMILFLAMEIADKKGWKYLWVEIDSKLALLAFENYNIVSWTARNRWQIASSLDFFCAGHIFLERAMLVLTVRHQ
jgi:hypothetical protein